VKTMTIVAVILIIIGVIALTYGGFSFTTKEKVAEVGPLKLEKERTRWYPAADPRRGVPDRRGRPARGQPPKWKVAPRGASDTVADASARAANS
jgi:hypothetical protein